MIKQKQTKSLKRGKNRTVTFVGLFPSARLFLFQLDKHNEEQSATRRTITISKAVAVEGIKNWVRNIYKLKPKT